MKDDELQAIRERAESAERGPWRVCGASNAECQCGFVWPSSGNIPVADVTHIDQDCGERAWDQFQANKRFIAHARDDIPALLAYVDELRKELAKTGQASRAEHQLYMGRYGVRFDIENGIVSQSIFRETVDGHIAVLRLGPQFPVRAGHYIQEVLNLGKLHYAVKAARDWKRKYRTAVLSPILGALGIGALGWAVAKSLPK